jgi:transposase-like protein
MGDEMADLTFEQLISGLADKALSLIEVARLRAWIASLHHPGECIALIEQAAQGRGCPHCGGQRIHRCGHASGLQRYRCLRCRCSYNALTGTPLARLRKKEHWLDYFQCVLDSLTVRAAASRVGVHRTTSFRWRHRFVPGAIRERPPSLSGVVEIDETYLLESQKGSRHMRRPARHRGGVSSRRGINREHDCLVVARDRNGATLDFHTGRGPVRVWELTACLDGVLAPDILLVSDGAAVYRRFASDTGISHKYVNLRAGIRVRGVIHIQNVNGWHSRFKGWLMHFRGVASKYLANYSGWQRLLDAHALVTPVHWLLAAAKLFRPVNNLPS